MRRGLRRAAANLLCTGIALFCAFAAGAAQGATTRPRSPLARTLDGILSAPALRGAAVAAVVETVDDGRVLYERDADRVLIPASNEKLLTAIAALETWGPAFRFETPVLAVGKNRRGRVRDLCLVGGGDPALTSEQLWRLSADLKARGLEQVSGDILIDDSLFDSVRWHPGWEGVGWRAYHGPIGALNVNYGAFAVHVLPDGAGDRARVTVDPPIPSLRVTGAVRVRGTGRARVRIELRGTPHGDRVAVSGTVPRGHGPLVYYRRVSDPGLYAGEVFRLQLAAAGVGVRGRVRRARCPADATELLRFAGRPLSEVVRLFLKYSNNVIAETLVKDLAVTGGGRGTWKAGVAVIENRLRALGLWASGMRVADGSGLARSNAVSPRVLARALRLAASSFRYGPEFLSALPLAGEDGTLRERAVEARERVRAKTGLLAGVAALSGLALGPGHRWLAFSVLVQGHRSADADVMAVLDRFAAAVAGGSASAPQRLRRQKGGAPRTEGEAEEGACSAKSVFDGRRSGRSTCLPG